MELSISGTVAQTAELRLGRGDTMWASKGSLISYSPGLKWDVRVPGGLGAAFKRSLSGEGMALTHVEADEQNQRLILGANAPGHVVEWDLDELGPVVTTRGAFLAAWGADIEITATVARRGGAMFFGGAGFVLQKVRGRGTVLIHGRGDLIRERLTGGHELLVSTGDLAAFSDTVDYDITRVGGLKKSLFGREGLFVTKLRGPGAVVLQSLKPETASRKSSE